MLTYSSSIESEALRSEGPNQVLRQTRVSYELAFGAGWCVAAQARVVAFKFEACFSSCELASLVLLFVEFGTHLGLRLLILALLLP